MLVNGQWAQNWQPVQSKDDQGRFIRQTSTFRHWVTPDGRAGPTGSAGFKAEAGRYHLYVAYICPWACRTLMALQLKGLSEMISVSVVNPCLTPEGWRFGGFSGSKADPAFNVDYLHQLYTRADNQFSGRATVPVLWDKKTQTIVNNESADIVRMLNSAFSSMSDSGPDLYPRALAGDIDSLNHYLYDGLNNGVYKAGFASSQFAYEEAYQQVFATLDALEHRLSDGRPYLFGEKITESDIRLFVTLIRFDTAYYGLFKCNRNTLVSMPFLHEYMHRIWTLPGVASTVHLDHIKAGYYSVKSLNPTGVVPLGPEVL